MEEDMNSPHPLSSFSGGLIGQKFYQLLPIVVINYKRKMCSLAYGCRGLNSMMAKQRYGSKNRRKLTTWSTNKGCKEHNGNDMKLLKHESQPPSNTSWYTLTLAKKFYQLGTMQSNHKSGVSTHTGGHSSLLNGILIKMLMTFSITNNNNKTSST